MHKILQQAPGKAKHCYASSRHPTLGRKERLIMTGFVPFFQQKIQGHISHFSRTPFSAKKSLESMLFFLVLPQH